MRSFIFGARHAAAASPALITLLFSAMFTPAAWAESPLPVSLDSPTNVQIVVPEPGTGINESAWILQTVNLGDLDASAYDSLAVNISRRLRTWTAQVT